MAASPNVGSGRPAKTDATVPNSHSGPEPHGMKARTKSPKPTTARIPPSHARARHACSGLTGKAPVPFRCSSRTFGEVIVVLRTLWGLVRGGARLEHPTPRDGRREKNPAEVNSRVDGVAGHVRAVELRGG